MSEAQGRKIQIGSWVIGGFASGLAFREGRNDTYFSESNPFLVHTVRSAYSNNISFMMTPNQ